MSCLPLNATGRRKLRAQKLVKDSVMVYEWLEYSSRNSLNIIGTKQGLSICI